MFLVLQKYTFDPKTPMKIRIMKNKNLLILLLFVLTAFAGFSQPNADFTASPTTICVGGSVQFTNLSTGSVNYNWTFPDGSGGQTSILVSPLITYNNVGTFPVILVAVAANLTSDTETKISYITVIAAATSTLITASGTDNQTLCIGDPLDTIQYTLVGAQGAVFSGLPPGVTGSVVADSSGGTVTITGTPFAAGVYNYSFTTTLNSCAPITVNGTITVDAQPTISLTSGNPNQVVCVNTIADTITYTIGGTATGATVSGLPPGMISSFAGGVLTISGTPLVAGPFPFTVATSGSVCPPATDGGVINVDPYITLASPFGTDNQTVCVNDPIIDIVYILGTGFTGATVDTLPPGMTGTFLPGLFTISGASSQIGTVFYTITTIGGSCGPASASGSITITAGPTLNLTSGPLTDFQAICTGSSIVDIEYTVGGSATGAIASGLPAGITGNLVGNVLTITGSSTQIGVFPFSVTTTGSACGNITLLGQITVDTFPLIQALFNPISDTQQLCINSAIDSIWYLFSGSATGAIGINLPTGVNVTIQGDTVIVSDTASSPGIYAYTIFTTGGACPADSVYGLITVDDSLGLQLLSAVGSDSQVLCDNNGNSIDTIMYLLSSGADTAVVTGLPPGVVDTFYNDTLQITGTPAAPGTYTYTMVVSGSFCPNDTITGTIEVQTAQLLLVSDPYTNDQLVCLNTGIVSIAYIVGGPVLVLDLPTGVISTYVAGAPNLLVISGTPSAIGSFHYSLQFSGPCGNSLAVGYITVSGGIENFIAGPDTTINLGQSVDLFAIGDNLTSYVWTPNGTLSNPIIFDPVATPTETTTYTVTVTDDYGCTSSLPVTLTVLTDIELFIPNLFSPNGDGFNDTWVIPNLDLFPGTSVTVINREGQVVYENPAYDNTWDGTFEGKKLPEATYYYLLKFSSTSQVLKGAVTILRNEK
jgi:gliding motility-associated-like protein|tara:strand:+ start:2804 stop:5605 length:2802 start_codon:yes stop_codon:yes gene_type:complete